MMVTSRLLVLAGVESIRDRHYAYSSCDRCYSKVLFDGDTSNWVCIKCRSNRPNVLRRYRMNFRITDNMRLTNVTVFGHNLDKFFGCTADEFYQNLQSLSQICPQLINENLIDSVIEDTFVGHSFLFGFKLPHAKHRDNVGNLPSLDMILPNQDGSSLPRGLPYSEKTLSDTIAWQMLFACSDQRFMTVLARIRQIVDNVGSSQCLNSVVNESSLFTISGNEMVPSLSHAFSVGRKRISSIDHSEQSLVLSCDQDAGCTVEPKQLTEPASGYSSLQSLGHLPGSIAEYSFTSTMTSKLILSKVPRAEFETIGTNTQFNNVRLSQLVPACDVSKGNNYDSGICSNVMAGKDETLPIKMNEVNCKKWNNVSDLQPNTEPGRLKRELDKKSPEVAFDESSADEIEICRAADVVSQECRVLAGDFSFKRCSALAVSPEIKKKRISQNSPSQLDIHGTTSAQLQSCTLDLVEAPYSEDLEAFLKDYEENERLTCELLAVPASNSKRVVCRLESISHDSLSENKNDLELEQPYSEDLEEFLRGHKSGKKLSQVRLKTLNSSSMLQQMSVQDSFTSVTIASKPIEPACPHVSNLRSLTESGCSDELFSFWSDDFEQQVAHSSLHNSVEKPPRHCSSQQPLAESDVLLRHSSAFTKNRTKDLRRNSLQQSPGQSPVKHFNVAKTGEICSIASLNETKENVEPKAKLLFASDMFDSSSSILYGPDRKCPQRIRKSIKKPTSSAATPPAICIKETPRHNCFLIYKTPVNSTSSSSELRANACDGFSSKSLHEKVLENCVTRKSIIVFNHSTKKAGNRTVSTPGDHSFDLFQSPCFIHTGLSRRHSRLRADFPSGMKFQFSSTPLSTNGVCRLSQQSPVIVENFPRRLADSNGIAANTRLHLAEPCSPDCIASTIIPLSPRHTRQLNSYQVRTSSLVCENAVSRSASLMSSISPELFGNSLEGPSYELSPDQAVCSWIAANRKEIPVACNLFSSSEAVNRASMSDNIPGLPLNQSDDLFGDSGDLFPD